MLPSSYFVDVLALVLELLTLAVVPVLEDAAAGSLNSSITPPQPG